MIWLVSVEECDYDEYDAVVIRAKTEERALELAKKKFTSYQWKKHKIEKVNWGGPEGEILASFNAG